ncbi:head-tail adaptor protein [Sphingobacterium corticis]|uniref:Head-tail adaptor protein n=1 Tax=Sphingobacterium corticis TaxID=1812823 RepID=A0ABW5NEX1_9SPHI
MALKHTLIGRRSEVVSIYRMERVRDEGGGTTTLPVLYWQTMADVQHVKASRVAQSFQDKLKKVLSIRFRYRSDKQLEGSMTAEVDGKKMAIHSIDTDTYRDRFVEIIVTGD